MSRIIGVAIGLLLLVLNYRVLKGVVKLYLRPGSEEFRFRFLTTDGSVIPQVLLIHLGLTLLITALIPDTGATQKEFEWPKSMSVTMLILALAVGTEELLFRVIPWGVLFLIRKLAKRAMWSEYLHIAIAIGFSAVFGLIHVTNYDNPDVWTYLFASSQMIGGLLWWYLVEKEGIFASFTAHFLWNATIFAIGWLAK